MEAWKVTTAFANGNVEAVFFAPSDYGYDLTATEHAARQHFNKRVNSNFFGGATYVSLIDAYGSCLNRHFRGY